MSQQMIADPQALGAQYQLGNHRTTYMPSTTLQIIGWSFVICVVVLIPLIVLAVFAPSKISLSLLGLPVIGLALYGIIAAYRNRVLRVFVYDYGFIHVGQTSLQCLYWQNVQAVWHKVEKHTTGGAKGHSSTTYKHIYTVNCIDGTCLKLDQTFIDPEQLGRSIEKGTAPYIFPLVLKTYQTSQAVSFGPLMVTPQGLRYGAMTLPWAEMKSIDIDEHYGQIVIKKQGKPFTWASMGLGDLPNVEVFRMLVQHITGVRP